MAMERWQNYRHIGCLQRCHYCLCNPADLLYLQYPLPAPLPYPTTLSTNTSPAIHRDYVILVFYAIAAVFTIAGSGLLVVNLNPSSPAFLIYGLSVLVAVGAGLSMTIAYPLVSFTLEPQDVGPGNAFLNIAQIGGQVLTLGYLGRSTSPREIVTSLLY
ncbi:uncharacterized protein F4807DRAFT_420204 [Annulohypoxylon truncatum]|uniref:uncharacterized protein n=1 Tax=Annulohypoxylon truncatum TaxID=327061 RepID=UPI0020073DF5|nr:uncharacterized protein F4807DRAFT_420204 [Annulohypoxylon truncatum]KAI1211391.1 hypothetical protein F4807DRAFT_420204 [Annulohypoxylon truncatum]